MLDAIQAWLESADTAGAGRKHIIEMIHYNAEGGGGVDGIVLHFRALSVLWGFADDEVLSVRCIGGAAVAGPYPRTLLRSTKTEDTQCSALMMTT